MCTECGGRRHYRTFKSQPPEERPVIVPPPPPPRSAIGTYKLCDPATGAVYYVELQSDGRILPVSGKV